MKAKEITDDFIQDIYDQCNQDTITKSDFYLSGFKDGQSYASTPTRQVSDEDVQKYAEKESVIHSMGYPEQSDSNRTLDAKDSFLDGFKSCYQWMRDQAPITTREEKVLICDNCKEFYLAPKEKCDSCNGTTFTSTHESNARYVKSLSNR